MTPERVITAEDSRVCSEDLKRAGSTVLDSVVMAVHLKIHT